MQNKSIRILSTRPLSDALIEKASRENVILDTATFIEVKKMISSKVALSIKGLATKPATVIFTSMNAVEMVVEQLNFAPDQIPDWKIYCLGGSSFTLVKKYWKYENVNGNGKDASDLAQRIISDKVEEVHFFCGNIRREELPTLLAEAGVKVNEYVVYETIHTPVEVSVSLNAVLFFSPSAADSFFSLNKVNDETVLFAIGNATAETLKRYSNNKIVVGEFPAKEQLVEKAIDYFSVKGK